MNEILYKPVTEVVTEGQFVKNIGFKPKAAPYVCLAMGVGLLLVSNLLIRLMGIFFILMSVTVFALVKDYRVMDIYDKGILIYGDREGKMAYFLKFEDIVSWKSIRDDGHDILEFVTADHQKINKHSFQTNAAFSVINSLIPEKEERYLQKLKDREQPFDVSGSIEKIRNRFFKKK